MRNFTILAAVASVFVVLVGTEAQADSVARGKYLVTIMGCGDCHTPTVPGPGGAPVPDMKRLLSGHPEGLTNPTWTPADMQQRHAMALPGPMLTVWAGPWGVSFATNLTPD
ncbi:MAG TPA: hypothetical protein VN812_17385 [Candidatus Acidoferrales bacterium]|nr:hypothetical protein [Candidatus Acidoferrales bacterium]